jgi:hypothetical protein
VSGDAWYLDFQAPSDFSYYSKGVATAFYWDTPGFRLPFHNSADITSVDFKGTIAVLRQDDEAGTEDIYLIEGAFAGQPFEGQVFEKVNDGQTALHVWANEAGEFGSEEVPLDVINDLVPLDVRALHFGINMVNPVAASSNEAQQTWYFNLDLDGRLDTGEQADDVYTGLGTDLSVRLRLDENGAISGRGLFWDRLGQRIGELPVEVQLSADRRVVDLYIPLIPLFAALPTLTSSDGQPIHLAVTPSSVHWRVAAVNYSFEDDPPKDVYPEVDADYTAAVPLNAPIVGDEEPAELTIQPPEGFQMHLSATMSGGGPEVAFSGETVNSDPENPVIGWLWDFADGTTSTEQSPRHTYADPGEYRVSLTITFANGATIVNPMTVRVEVGSGVALAAPPEQFCTATANANANLRGGPGTGYTIVGSTAAGDSLTVVGQNTAGDWYQLWREDGSQPWIAGFLTNGVTCPAGFALPVTG